MQPLLAVAIGVLILFAIVAVGVIFLHWFALGLTVSSAAANQFLLQVLAFVAVIAVVVAAGWYWWRKL